MVGKFLLIFCLAKVVSSECGFDDRQIIIMENINRLEESNNQGGSDYSAIENPKRRFGFSVVNGKTVVKYRLRGAGVNPVTRQAVEESMQELQEQVRCLNIEFTEESPLIEPSMDYDQKNRNRIGISKIKQEPYWTMTNQQQLDVYWRGWFEHCDMINPEKILTIDIQSTPMWSFGGGSLSYSSGSGSVLPSMRLLTMDRAISKLDQEIDKYRSPVTSATLKKSWKGVFMHEMFHVFGIAHTQRRKDRDEFINIKLNNIKRDAETQYDKCTECTVSGPYECNSIMHYSPRQGAINGKPTMTGKAASCTSFGNDEPTANDWIALRKNLGC